VHHRCEHLERTIGVAQQALGCSQQKTGGGMAGRGFEYFSGLFGGQARVALQQSRCMRERDFDAANRLCSGAQRISFLRTPPLFYLTPV
jgi:hypothetical protein